MPGIFLSVLVLMITLSLFAVSIIGLMLTRRVMARWAVAVLLLALYAVNTGAFNPAITQATSVSSGHGQWGDKNLIVLLGVGLDVQSGRPLVPTFALPRLLKAIETYRSCNEAGRLCTLLISGGVTSALPQSEAEVYQERILQAAPDMAGHIELETNSRNTWENAKNSSSWARTHAYNSLWLVTSLLHARRSEAYFEHFGLEIETVVSEQALPSPSWMPSAWNLLMADIFVHEQIGLLRYAVYEGMGWNSK